MNVKTGNTSVIAGDYSTYNGLQIGLLKRHTYNDAFLAFTEEKGFDCEIYYYETPTELTNALVNDEVDALVNSYIRTPEDERVVEDFGQTPLNVVLGMTQIVQKYTHDPVRLKNALENINSEGNYLLSLINSIFDINQLEYGHMDLNQQAFAPAECVEESTEMIRPFADKKEQHFEVDCSECKDWVVVGDSSRFSQIMVNIISNAIKYTDIGEPEGNPDDAGREGARGVCRIRITIIFKKKLCCARHGRAFWCMIENRKVSFMQGRRTGWKLRKISNGRKNWNGWICCCIRDSLSCCFRASDAGEEKRKYGLSI